MRRGRTWSVNRPKGLIEQVGQQAAPILRNTREQAQYPANVSRCEWLVPLKGSAYSRLHCIGEIGFFPCEPAFIVWRAAE
ncbi:MAG: hypothetical protein AAFR75_13875, partial [Pseudomonadota bacterium]